MARTHCFRALVIKRIIDDGADMYGPQAMLMLCVVLPRLLIASSIVRLNGFEDSILNTQLLKMSVSVVTSLRNQK